MQVKDKFHKSINKFIKESFRKEEIKEEYLLVKLN